MFSKLNIKVFMLLVFAIILSVEPAWAYIDPGLGSMLLQGIIAAIAGLIVTIRLYWHRIQREFNWSQKG